jgi:hypothetical protein
LAARGEEKTCTTAATTGEATGGTEVSAARKAVKP